MIDGEKDLQTAGSDLFDMLVETANGKMTKAETLGHAELFCITRK